MQPTVFTRILAGEIPAALVYRGERIFAFMDAGQLNPGHVLVAPCEAYPTLLDMDEDLAAELMRVSHRVARAVQEAFQPPGMMLLQANGVAGGQTVPHAHIHVLPRHEDDGVGLVWPRKNPDMAVLEAYAARIRMAG
ncbi:HIT family protein [Castellaniella sp.]|uniref:HIT family protein n=1 Tax=Castellaniella sp. TaxID=1955812 RepID=UPI00355D455F